MHLASIVSILFLSFWESPGITMRTNHAGRQIWGWVKQNSLAKAFTQLEANPALFDGVHLWCGLMVQNATPLLPTLYLGGNCSSRETIEFSYKVKALGIELHMGIGLEESRKVMPPGLEHKVDMSGIIQSSISLAKKHGWGGFNFDDESEICPRKDPTALGNWVKNVGEWADALQEAGLLLTADVQAMTCSACSPWPACLPENRQDLSAGTLGTKLQSNLANIRNQLSATQVHRWIEMDTYYGKYTQFIENLDWYTNWLLPIESMGLGVCPNSDCNPTSDNQTQVRFDALEQTAITRIDVWRLPLEGAAAEVWLPKLRFWKQR